LKAVILAAGTSSRLRPYTDNVPKCLLEVAGRPILARALEHLVSAGVCEVILVTGFHEEKIRDFVQAHGITIPVTFVSNTSFDVTNNAYSLLLTRELVAADEFVLLDSDIVFERSVLGEVLRSTWPDCLALRSTAGLGDEEMKCELGIDGCVVSIGKDVPVAHAGGESIGIERFGPTTSSRLFEVLDQRVAAGGEGEYYEDSLQQMIDEGLLLWAVSVRGFCAEIDTIEDLERVNSALEQL